jgi:putative tricarboxylic transport membrane protein
MEAFWAGLLNVFTWPTFGFMLVGIAIGFAVGILPGLGGPTALALMLPFIFDMKPVDAFAFLLGMTSVTATTGDITSVLFGIPGEATTAATVVDGHPMAKRGEAGRALGAVLMSSLLGAVIGAFFLALAIPIVRPLVLAFGSPEFFMLSLMGITFLAALSGEATLKGLLAGGLGLLVSMVGMDAQSGTQRYTFGQLALWDGVSLVAATIGLFAIPEIIELFVKGTSIAEQQVGKLGGVLQGVKDTFRHWWLVVRCSVLGAFLGMIPGLGGSVAQWLAYAHAVQTSPNKERFGKGAIEGVLGPGAANNSKEGGNLIPTVAFGVPGSLTMAILLGAFLIQGLVPGPAMLTRHLELTYSFVWLIVVSNVVTVALCFLFLEHLAKITHLRGNLVIPFLLVLVYFGAFADRNNAFDMIVMLVFGALGFFMVQFGWPRPPLVLGMVLGRLAENYLYLSYSRYSFEFLGRPIVLALLVVTLGVVFVPVVQGMLRRRGILKTPVVEHG